MAGPTVSHPRLAGCCVLVLGISIALLSQSSQAAVILSLEPGSTDLSNVSVGQTLEIDVVLSGLEPGQSLDYLAGTVLFDGSLLGSAFDILPGGAIPDVTGFMGIASDGLADANFDALFAVSGDTISANGVFYSFSVTALQPGAGPIAFDLTTLAARDPLGNEVAIAAGNSLEVSIADSTSTVPEPGTWIALSLAALLCRAKRGLRTAFSCAR